MYRVCRSRIDGGPNHHGPAGPALDVKHPVPGIHQKHALVKGLQNGEGAVDGQRRKHEPRVQQRPGEPLGQFRVHGVGIRVDELHGRIRHPKPILREHQPGLSGFGFEQRPGRRVGAAVGDCPGLELQHLPVLLDVRPAECPAVNADGQQSPEFHVLVINEWQEFLELDPAVIGAIRVAVGDAHVVVLALGGRRLRHGAHDFFHVYETLGYRAEQQVRFGHPAEKQLPVEPRQVCRRNRDRDRHQAADRQPPHQHTLRYRNRYAGSNTAGTISAARPARAGRIVT